MRMYSSEPNDLRICAGDAGAYSTPDPEPIRQEQLTQEDIRLLRKQSSRTFNIRRIPLRTINAMVGE
jgi:hypothetical protein